jgi:hypothetical protein
MAAHRKFQMTTSFVFSRSGTTRYDGAFADAALMTWVASSKLLIVGVAIRTIVGAAI